MNMGAWKYNYVNPTDFNVYKLLKEGEGKFVVKAVFDKDKDGFELQDKNGLPKLKMVLNVTDIMGNSSLIDDYLTGSWPAKIHEFALGVGLPGLYNAAGILDTTKLIGLNGNCLIKNEVYNNKESSKIATYLAGESKYHDMDQEIPF
jgi:hypothetical protein